MIKYFCNFTNASSTIDIDDFTWSVKYLNELYFNMICITERRWFSGTPNAVQSCRNINILLTEDKITPLCGHPFRSSLFLRDFKLSRLAEFEWKN